MIGQRGGGEDRTFGAVGHARLQDAAWRHGRIAVEAEIDRQPVEEGLDLLRRVEAHEQPMLGRRQQCVQPAAISGHQGAKGSEVSDIFCVLHTFLQDFERYRRSPQRGSGRKNLHVLAAKTTNFFLFSGSYCGFLE